MNNNEQTHGCMQLNFYDNNFRARRVFGIAVGTHICHTSKFKSHTLLKHMFSDCSLHLLCCESLRVVEWRLAITDIRSSKADNAHAMDDITNC